ncbi:HAD family hydrolase [Corynebacterium sp. S7]
MHPSTPSALLADTTGILFDFNGTLSNDESLLESSYAHALTELGYSPLLENEYSSLLGLSEPDIAEALIRSRTDSDVSSRSEELIDAFALQYQQACRIQPRVSGATVDMVRRLADSHRLGIVTGTLRKLIEPVLADLQIDTYFQVIVTIEDVQKGKPDPEGFLLGAKSIGIEPHSIVAVEDSKAGIASARAAGMHVVGVGPSSGMDNYLNRIEDFFP